MSEREDLHGERDPRELMRDALCGELSAEDVQRLDEDPEWRERYGELRAVVDRLDAYGERRRTGDLASERTDVPGFAATAEALRNEMEGPASRAERGGGSSPVRWVMGLVAAAALLAAVFGWRALEWRRAAILAEREAAERMLLGGEIALVFPVGDLAEADRFEWRADLPEGGWYVVEVAAEDDLEFERPLAVERDLEEPTWVPDKQDIAAWPARLRWRVSAYDATGQRFAVGVAQFARSR